MMKLAQDGPGHCEISITRGFSEELIQTPNKDSSGSTQTSQLTLPSPRAVSPPVLTKSLCKAFKLSAPVLGCATGATTEPCGGEALPPACLKHTAQNFVRRNAEKKPPKFHVFPPSAVSNPFCTGSSSKSLIIPISSVCF